MVQQTGLEEALQILASLTDGRSAVPIALDLGKEGSRLMVEVPKMVRSPEGQMGDELVWEAQAEDHRAEATWVLDEFVLLADAERERLEDFAQRFGPLWLPAAPSSNDPEPTDIVEPVAFWREHARSLYSLLELASGRSSDRVMDRAAWSSAIRAPHVPWLLRQGYSETGEKHRSAQVANAEGYLLFGGFISSQSNHAEETMLLRAITTSLLTVSGVRPDSGLGETQGAGPFYALPLKVGYDPSPGSDKQPLVIGGLLPALALQTVSTIRDNRLYPCSGCRRIIPIPPDAKRPRRGISFYGNHEACRQEARRKSLRASQRRHYHHKKQLASTNNHTTPSE
jgi:hypothetical protein